VWPAGILIVTVAAAILANSAAGTAALAQQRVPIAQQRDEAPIWHVQPRMQDLPSGVAQKEEETLLELDDIAKKLDRSRRESVQAASACPGEVDTGSPTRTCAKA
jgi:hypothetical protein